MHIRVDRESVAAGDDGVAHDRVLEIPDGLDLEAVIAHVLRDYELPSIGGGKATWVVVSSRQPLAVVAQEWTAPRMLWPPRSLSACSIVDGVVRIYFSYIIQIDPEVVVKVLEHLRLDR